MTAAGVPDDGSAVSLALTIGWAVAAGLYIWIIVRNMDLIWSWAMTACTAAARGLAWCHWCVSAWRCDWAARRRHRNWKPWPQHLRDEARTAADRINQPT